MALTADQRWIAEKIDSRMQKLLRAGKDDRSIFTAMADHMPKLKQLLDTADLAGLDELTRKFPGAYRYVKVLEALAGDIRSGAIPVPGRIDALHPMKPATGHRQRAAAIDLRMRQLAEEGVPHSAIIERMTVYVSDLGVIWNATSDAQLAALCREYPGFHRYATLMEEAAETERQKPTRAYDDLPELADPLREQLSSLLSTAASLERDYQSVIDVAGTSASTDWRLPLSGLHAQWEADLIRFKMAIQDASVPQKSRDMIFLILERMAQLISKLEASLQAS